jgi:hypothetical protein
MLTDAIIHHLVRRGGGGDVAHNETTNDIIILRVWLIDTIIFASGAYMQCISN